MKMETGVLALPCHGGVGGKEKEGKPWRMLTRAEIRFKGAMSLTFVLLEYIRHMMEL